MLRTKLQVVSFQCSRTQQGSLCYTDLVVALLQCHKIRLLVAGPCQPLSTVHTGSWQACSEQRQTVCRFTQGSGVERSGAAQGLAEVLGVLGPEYLAGLLPDILATCAAKAAVAREGSLTLFKYLPLAMPDECQVGTLPASVHPNLNSTDITGRQAPGGDH